MMPEKRMYDFFKSYFQNPQEIMIIQHLLFKREESSVSELYDDLMKKKPKLGLNSELLEKIILDLIQKGWIEETSQNPKKIRICPSDEFKICLNEKIDNTQEKLNDQKENYYKILQLLKFKENNYTFNAAFAEMEKDQIPEKYPKLLKSAIFEIRNKYPMVQFNYDKSLLVHFPQINLVFQMHTFELKIDKSNVSCYGGVHLCQISQDSINPAIQTKIINRIHTYHWNNLEMKYKLEKGGYYPARNRQICETYFSPEIQLNQNNELFESNYSLSVKNLENNQEEPRKLQGNLLTKVIPLENQYVCSIFGESKDLIKNLTRILQL